jgi:hypothetical protein
MEEGESGWSFVADKGDGDALVETTGVVPLDTSPMANVARRSLSSRFDLCAFVSGKLLLLGNEAGPGLPER